MQTKFNKGSVILDPFRYIKRRDGVKIIEIGEGTKYKLFDFVILIPIYNDGDKIKSLRRELKKYLSIFSFFICFVDDSEDDNTSLEIKNNFNKNFKILKRIKKEKYSTRFSASIYGFEWIVNNINSKYIVEIDS